MIDLKRENVPPDGRPDALQPRWRHDFPINWPQDHYISRRDFTRFMVLTSFAFVVGQFWIVARNFWRRRHGEAEIFRVAAVDQVPIGGALTFTYPAAHDSCILVRSAADKFVAFSQKCTHLSCAVVPDCASQCFRCPCHEGSFDLQSGAPLAGPPRRRLPRITIEVRQGNIYATGIEETA